MNYENRYRPTERGIQFGKEEAGGIRKDTGAILEDIDADLNRLEECVHSIGTSLDSTKNRNELNRMKDVIMRNVQTAEEDIKDMRQKAIGPQKVKVEQYQKKLVSQVTKFNNLLQKAKTETQQQETEMNQDQPPPYDGRQPATQAQAQLNSGNLTTREEEHREVLLLEQDIMGLRDIQHDLATMVNEQGEMIDDIEKNTADAQVRTEQANRNLEKAVALKRANRKMICIIVTIVVIIALVIVIALAIGLGVGLTYVGAVSPFPTSSTSSTG